MKKKLAEDAEVLMAQIEKANGKTTVVVKLKYVDNLAQAYSRIEGTVKASLGTRL